MTSRWRTPASLATTSRCLRKLVLQTLAILLSVTAYAESDMNTDGKLRVCADPNNLPYTNQREQGFENRLATLLAADLGLEVEYTWHAQRRGFLRNTLLAGVCDIVMGVPTALEMVLTTQPYYRSTYGFLYPAGKYPGLASFDDERLHELRVGIHLVGDDGSNTPPELALARRGIVDNVVGYMIQGDYSQENPPARLVEAVASGEIDVAALWGPLAGYFAPRQHSELTFASLAPPHADFIYAISMGVRHTDTALKETLDAFLLQRRSDIEHLLLDYGVPLLPLQQRNGEDIHD